MVKIFKYLLTVLLPLVAYKSLNAQEIDSTLVGNDIFYLLSEHNDGSVKINQENSIKEAFSIYISNKSKGSNRGYRIFVYSNSNQDARSETAKVVAELEEAYPGHKVYRNYKAPVFSVQIGNFKTKSDAMKIFSTLIQSYPGAKIVRAKIDWYTF